MRKLNFGCGNRYADGWCNIDFVGRGEAVQAVDLLRGFPFRDGSFDAVYSSHVLEHFTPRQAVFLLGEARRVLRRDGTLRLVVPDLENSCREYLRILALDDRDPSKAERYRWVMVELLDQLVRTRSRGEMGPMMDRAAASDDRELAEYIRSRSEIADPPEERPRPPLASRLRRLSGRRVLDIAAARLRPHYLRAVARLLPAHLREEAVSGTAPGEKHRWMYDRYGLALLLRECRYGEVTFTDHLHSRIPGFVEDLLDGNADGSPYKPGSLYCEARA